MYVLLSYPLSESTPSYGNFTHVKLDNDKRIAKGDSSNTQKISMPNHIGTHVDAPRHFFPKGACIADYPVEFWKCDKAEVVVCNNNQPRWLMPDDLEGRVDTDSDCILIKTDYCMVRDEDDYWIDNPGISPELGEWLKKKCARLKFVGIDSVSVSRIRERAIGRVSHKTLLGAECTRDPILPIEDMDFTNIDGTTVFKSLWIVPMILKESDGAPVTVIAEIE